MSDGARFLIIPSTDQVGTAGFDRSPASFPSKAWRIFLLALAENEQ
jgi:hypothetical protein